jgi:hypothetical protein
LFSAFQQDENGALNHLFAFVKVNKLKYAVTFLLGMVLISFGLSMFRLPGRSESGQ